MDSISKIIEGSLNRRWFEVTRKQFFRFLLSTLSLLFVACAPQAAPSPRPATMPVSSPTQPLSAPAPALSPEEAAWAKIVEAARKEGTVTVYSGSWMGEAGIALARAFQERYGIKMELIFSKSSEFMERMKVEQRTRQYVVDVNDSSAAGMSRVKQDGLGETLTPMALPVFQEKGVWVLTPSEAFPEGNAMLQWYTSMEFWVNTRLVPLAEEPRSFKDVLHPRWQGKMIIAEPTLNSAPYQVFVTLINNKVLDWDYVKALGRQDLKIGRTTAEMFSLLARGEAHLAPVGAAIIGTPVLLAGAPIKPIHPEEGTVVITGGSAIIKNAPHPNAAKVLVNWVASQEGQAIFTRAAGMPSIRKDVPDFRPEAAKVPAKKLYVHSDTDSDEAVKMMRDRFIPNLWKQ